MSDRPVNSPLSSLIRVLERRAPFLWDTRFWWVALQIIVPLLLAVAIAALLSNLTRNLEQQNISFGFNFLLSRAGFAIGDAPVAYSQDSPYWRALWVGVLNSLRVAIAGIVLATFVGITVGIARLSSNWLVRNLALVYVEILRNTPLLLQILFWYFAVFLKGGEELTALPLAFYLDRRGLYIPWFEVTGATGIWLLLLLGGAIGAIAVWRWRIRVAIEQGVPGRGIGFAVAVLALAIALAALVTQSAPIRPDLPQLQDERLVGGLRLSPEFAAILAGLSFFTAAFIAEIVRGGIQAVPKGQWEAARALGLSGGLSMRLVIFPQALRVIIPPLNSEYLNLWKNSSLAIVTGYPDVYAITATTINQTGKAIEGMLIIATIYLSVGLVISWLMNLFNRSVAFKN